MYDKRGLSMKSKQVGLAVSVVKTEPSRTENGPWLYESKGLRIDVFAS